MGMNQRAQNNADQAGSGMSQVSPYPTQQSTGSEGGGQAHENRPPYYALAFIMKT